METQYYLNACLFEHPIQYGSLRLAQIGRLQCGNENTGIPLHIHSEGLFELTVVNAGKGTMLTNNVCTEVKQGDMYLSFPCDTHVVQSSKEELQYDFLAFYTDDERFKKDLEIITQFYSPKERLFQDEKLAFLCRLAVEEYKNPSLYSQELLESLFQQILLLILRNFQSKQAKSDSSTLSKKALYTQLRNYINTHIYSLKNLNDLSDIFNYNYSYLSALFKELNGDTILAYYQKKRLNAAQLLIMERKLKINEISELLNYSSPSSFSRAFKEMYNISPKQYAKKLWNW